jgi:hypothetical protein
MYRVIDTIVCSNAVLQVAERGEGVLAILDPEQICEPPAIEGRAIAILKPDGSSAELTVSEVILGANSVVGLFFRGASEQAVTRGSLIRW